MEFNENRSGIPLWLRLLMQLIILLIVVTSGVYAVFYYGIGMEYFPEYFWVIPAFFLLESATTCLFVNEFEKRGKLPGIKTIFAMRVARILSGLILLAICILIDRMHLVSYAVVFVVYYLVCLAFETCKMSGMMRKESLKK